MKKLTVLLAFAVVTMLGCGSDSGDAGKDAADSASGMIDRAQDAADATEGHAEAAMITVIRITTRHKPAAGMPTFLNACHGPLRV